MCIRDSGDIRTVEKGLAHVYAHMRAYAVFNRKLRNHRAGERLHAEAFLFDNSGIIHIFGEAPYAVSAHLGLAAVAVENAHTRIAWFRVFHKDQPIPANACAPVAQPRRERILFFLCNRAVAVVKGDEKTP